MDKYMLTSNSNWYEMFNKNLIPGKVFSISEWDKEYDREGYTYRSDICISQIFLKVVSVSPPVFREGIFSCKTYWEKANAIVELPSGKTFPLFVYNPCRNERYYQPHLALNDIVYQELEKARFDRPHPPCGLYYILTPCYKYSDNSELIKEMKTVKEKQQAFKQKQEEEARLRLEIAYLEREREMERKRQNAALQKNVDELFRKM